jgi:hypothetical protein
MDLSLYRVGGFFFIRKWAFTVQSVIELMIEGVGRYCKIVFGFEI